MKEKRIIKAWAVLLPSGGIAFYKDGFAAICDYSSKLPKQFAKDLKKHLSHSPKVVEVEIHLPHPKPKKHK